MLERKVRVLERECSSGSARAVRAAVFEPTCESGSVRAAVFERECSNGSVRAESARTAVLEQECSPFDGVGAKVLEPKCSSRCGPTARVEVLEPHSMV